MASQPDKELIELCGKARDEEISPTELAKLEERLRADEEARRFYMDFMTLHALLERSEPIAVSNPKVKVHQRSRSRWFIAAAAALILLGVLINLPFDKHVPVDEPVALLIDHHGIKLIRDGKEVSLNGEVELYPSDEIKTTTDACALLGFKGEETAVLVAEETHVQLERSQAGGKLIKLLSGLVSCEVAPQPTGKPMLLHTAHGVFTVLGTQFTLNAGRKNSTLKVREGSVRVESNGHVAQVESGSSANVKSQQIQQSSLAEEEPATGVEGLVLIQAPHHERIPEFSPLTDGAVIDLAKLPTRLLNIEALVDEKSVGCVRFKLKAVSPKGKKLRPRGKGNLLLDGHGEVFFPYMLAGDFDDPPHPVKPFGWTPKPGTYELTATSYENPRDRGRKGPSLTVRFTVIDSSGKR